MSSHFSGPPIAHPERKLTSSFTGHIDRQSDDIAQMIAMIKTGWSTERAPKPIGTILLVLDNGVTISGTLMIESMSHVRNGISQFFLTEWDENIFRCYVVMIDPNNTLRVEVWENPPDPYHISSPRILA